MSNTNGETCEFKLLHFLQVREVCQEQQRTPSVALTWYMLNLVMIFCC